MKKLIPSLLLCVLFTYTAVAQEIEIELTLFADGFDDPVDLKNAGDDRLFVVEKDGFIRILNADGTTNPTPFLDVSSLVSTGSEQGLLSVAFHPDYQSNGFFYVNYTDTGGNTNISRFSVSGDPDVADPGSELILLEYNQPFGNHNGGCIAFGSDGYLYIASGDGGSGGDPGNRAQNTELLLGKLLRIDIDNPGGGNNYGIPADNPFAGSPTDAEEIWAYGLRNPWKFSFDATSGDVWIGDVGQNAMEEIDYAEATTAGINYGWRCYEGSLPFNTTDCPAPGTLIFPIGEYSSASGQPECSVTGGYVYRGSDSPDIQGYYFFADFCSGLIGSIHDLSNPTLTDYGTFGGTWSSFGEDVNNELYIVDFGGEIFKLSGSLILDVPDFSSESLRLYPNPATGITKIASESEPISEVIISDLKGSIVYAEEYNASQEVQLDLASLARGLYMIKIQSESGSEIVKKLVKQ